MLTEIVLYLLLKSSDGLGRGMKRPGMMEVSWHCLAPGTDSTESLTLGRNTQAEWQNTT